MWIFGFAIHFDLQRIDPYIPYVWTPNYYLFIGFLSGLFVDIVVNISFASTFYIGTYYLVNTTARPIWIVFTGDWGPELFFVKSQSTYDYRWFPGILTWILQFMQKYFNQSRVTFSYLFGQRLESFWCATWICQISIFLLHAIQIFFLWENCASIFSSHSFITTYHKFFFLTNEVTISLI